MLFSFSYCVVRRLEARCSAQEGGTASSLTGLKLFQAFHRGGHLTRDSKENPLNPISQVGSTAIQLTTSGAKALEISGL
jgi:hypothetical protein